MPVCFSPALCLGGLKEAGQSCICREGRRLSIFFKGLNAHPLFISTATNRHAQTLMRLRGSSVQYLLGSTNTSGL